MKVSYGWLRKYVPTKIRAKNLADALTMNGLEVTSIEEKGEDFIFEIEVTPNRSDALCHIGIAREVSAITGKRLKLPVFNLTRYFSKNIPTPKVLVQQHSACRRYTARIITDVCVGPSPKWLISRIESLGLRPVNNIVDITNFVLLETGQPLHAFDYDKLTEGKIIVRFAKETEEITNIDGEKRKLKSDILVIADADKPVAIAGIMGGQDTEVGPSTKRILLEAAYFDPVSIRRSSRYLGLATDSSYRFERGVDISKIIHASDRAASLICEIANGRTHKKIVDVSKKEKGEAIITLRPKRVNLLLGVRVSNADIRTTLSSIGFKVLEQKGIMKVTIPSFRKEDVKREVDLIEEIARIYGYDKIPTVLPNAIVTEETPHFKQKEEIVTAIREALAALAFNEALTYSLISSADIEKVNVSDINIISIKNPLSEQQEVMRNTLLAGLLKAINYNLNMGNADLRLYELSNIYFRQDEDLQENLSLSLGICGNSISDWSRKQQPMDLFYLKGVLKTLFDKLGIDVYFEESQHPSLEPDRTMAILAYNKMLGAMGLVKQEILAKMDIKKDVYAAEINTQVLFENARLEKLFKPIIRYPSSERDISICVDENISYESINRAIKDTAASFIKNIELIEQYRGKQIRENQRGLLIRITYRAKDRTLKETEIEKAHNEIREKLIRDFGVVIR